MKTVAEIINSMKFDSLKGYIWSYEHADSIKANLVCSEFEHFIRRVNKKYTTVDKLYFTGPSDTCEDYLFSVRFRSDKNMGIGQALLEFGVGCPDDAAVPEITIYNQKNSDIIFNIEFEDCYQLVIYLYEHFDDLAKRILSAYKSKNPKFTNSVNKNFDDEDDEDDESIVYTAEDFANQYGLKLSNMTNFAINTSVYFIDTTSLFNIISCKCASDLKKLFINSILYGTIVNIIGDKYEIQIDNTNTKVTIDSDLIFSNEIDALIAAADEFEKRITSMLSYIKQTAKK